MSAKTFGQGLQSWWVRLRLAWGLLRGRATIYGVKLDSGLWVEADGQRISSTKLHVVHSVIGDWAWEDPAQSGRTPEER